MKFSYFNPSRIFYGSDALQKTEELLEENNFSEALVVCGARATKNLPVTMELSKSHACYIDVNPNSPAKQVDEIASAAEGKDCIVAIGGGSVMDAAKAAAALVTNCGKTYDYLDGKEFTKKPLPCICVPTTAGTSSEISRYSVITDERKNQKKALGGEALYSFAAIEDPSLSYGMPPALAASTGLDAFSHCLESIVNVENNPISENNALKAISIISKRLPASVKGDKKARDDVFLGVMFAGLAFDQTGTTAVHKISYAFTLDYGVPHGFACALTLPHIMEENKKSAEEKIKRIESVLGGNVKKKTLELMKSVGAPTSLKEIGVKKEDLAKLASRIDYVECKHDVLPVTRERVARLLERIY
ncbi:iron-containing alcohol dehydrogenase [Candidatus Micrarchaeota archaeon]|nr:iron-containing alcohol dehydrogenase [Candidatus Micrarchaeota archaeon]